MEQKKYSHEPYGRDYRVLSVEVSDDKGNKAKIACLCHKIGPYPEQVVRKTGFGVNDTVTSVEMKRVPCSTQCLRATVIEKFSEVGDVAKPSVVFWRQDCEANILDIPLTNPPEEKKGAQCLIM